MVHWLLLAPAVPASIDSLCFGYRRHRYLVGLVIGGVGLSLMFIYVSHLIESRLLNPFERVGGIPGSRRALAEHAPYSQSRHFGTS